MHSIDCRRANLDRNKNSYYPVQILRLSRSEKIDHTLSINGWLKRTFSANWSVGWWNALVTSWITSVSRITIIAGKDSRACVTFPQNDTCMFDLSSIAVARTKLKLKAWPWPTSFYDVTNDAYEAEGKSKGACLDY